MADIFLAAMLAPILAGDPALAHISAISPDLAFIMGEYDLPDRLQARIAEKGYIKIYSFAMMAADRAGVLALASRSFLLNPAFANLPADLVDLAEINLVRLVAAWMAATSRFEESNKLASVSRASNLPIVIPKAMLVTLRNRFEALHGRTSDKIYPCAYMLELRLEEVEEGTLSATPLEEVICVELGADTYSSDALSAHGVRFRKAPKAIAVPKNGEELRTRFRTLSIAFVVAGFKHTSCLWLRTASMLVFSEYVEYLLSEHVANFQLDREELSVRATWATVLGYDLHMRKHAVRSILYDNLDFAAAMHLAMKDPGVRERHFTTPTALLTAAENRGTKRTSEDKHGGGDKHTDKGKGKGKGKTKTKSKDGHKGTADIKYLVTPDKKAICSNFNRTKGCSRAECGYVHACNRCFGAHSSSDKSCPKWKERSS